MKRNTALAITELDRQQIVHLAQAYFPVPDSSFVSLWPAMHTRVLQAGELLCRVNDQPVREYFLLEGIVRTGLCDRDGRSVTFDFYHGPCAIAPAITRSRDMVSRVDCEALSMVRVVEFSVEALNVSMERDAVLGAWGNAVLRHELLKRADKEIALISQSAGERLLAIYETMPQVYRTVAQHHLANYLGITPVSLSRLRRQLGRI